MKHLTTAQLEAGLDEIRRSPKDEGVLNLIVRRPQAGEREVLHEGELHPQDGLAGDNWITRGSSRMPDGSPHPDMQLNIMNFRVIALVAGDKSRWQTGRRPVVPGHGFERRKLARRDQTGAGLGLNRSLASTSPGL